MKDLNNMIKTAREKAGKRSDLAKEIDCSVGYLFEVETGKSKPSVEFCLRVSRVLDAPEIVLTSIALEVDELKKKIQVLLEMKKRVERDVK